MTLISKSSRHQRNRRSLHDPAYKGETRLPTSSIKLQTCLNCIALLQREIVIRESGNMPDRADPMLSSLSVTVALKKESIIKMKELLLA